MNMAIRIYSVLKKKENHFQDKSIIIQLIKSSSAVAANYRAATRGRSDAEFYSKICIVVEECDETQFWLNFMLKIKLLSAEEYNGIYPEVLQLVKMLSSTKRKMAEKLAKK